MKAVLNLDPNFKPISGDEISFQSFTFSGGEPHIKIDPDFDRKMPVTVTHRLRSFDDLGLLCMAVDALHRMDAILDTLLIPYFPAARQDRVMIPGEPLSVKVYAGIINAFGFKKVMVYDAHSEVTPAVLDHPDIISNHRFIQQVLDHLGSDVLLISPDGGALKKIYKLSEFLGGIPVIECSKSRDVMTGKLTGFQVYSDDLQGRDCLIVDDICDGGGTFIGLATALQHHNAGKLHLAVSHGIFSKGFDELTVFDSIFSTDSFRDIDHPLLTQIPLSHGLLS